MKLELEPQSSTGITGMDMELDNLGAAGKRDDGASTTTGRGHVDHLATQLQGVHLGKGEFGEQINQNQ